MLPSISTRCFCLLSVCAYVFFTLTDRTLTIPSNNIKRLPNLHVVTKRYEEGQRVISCGKPAIETNRKPRQIPYQVQPPENIANFSASRRCLWVQTTASTVWSAANILESELQATETTVLLKVESSTSYGTLPSHVPTRKIEAGSTEKNTFVVVRHWKLKFQGHEYMTAVVEVQGEI